MTTPLNIRFGHSQLINLLPRKLVDQLDKELKRTQPLRSVYSLRDGEIMPLLETIKKKRYQSLGKNIDIRI